MIKKYLRDSSGQFAIMFGICMTLLVVGAGTAVDISAMHKERASLQSITDLAVLAAAGLKTDKISDLKTASQASIDSNNFNNLTIKSTLTLKNDIIRVEANSTYKTQLMGIVGIGSVPVTAASSAPIPKDTPVNIVLVLDSTQSMSGANMTALRSASKKLLAVFNNADPGSIQAGVVPFSNYVNVGLENRSRPWMDVPDDGTTTSAEYCYMKKDLVDSSLCATESITTTCNNDSGPYECTRTSTTCPDEAYSPEYEYCYIPTSTQTWNGCVGSRDNPDHKDPEYKSRPFPGIMNVTCSSEILDLTTNLIDVEAKIDSLVATGSTYVPAGLAWGWRLLHPKDPYGGLTNSQKDRKRAMVLMSDGGNTVKLSAPYHYTNYTTEGRDESNALTSDLCTAIKNDGIDLYTVAYRLGEGDPSARSIINKCASGPAFSFNANNQTELENAFEDIANSLYEVRIIR